MPPVRLYSSAQSRRESARLGGLRVGSYRNIDRLVGETQYGVVTTVQDAIVQMSSILADQVGKETADYMERLYLSNLRGSRPALAHAHERVADKMQQAVLRQYKRSLNKANPIYSGHRPQSRLTGRLLPVLNDHDFVLASPNGIAFGNVSRLNKEARHWARLNFGAGPRGQGARPARFSLNVLGGSNFTLNVEGGPRPNIWMPYGAFLDSSDFKSTGSYLDAYGHTVGFKRFNETRQRFQPFRWGSFGRRYRTRGTRAKQFMDAGLETMARELPREYRDMADRWEREAATRGRGPASRVVRARPRA